MFNSINREDLISVISIIITYLILKYINSKIVNDIYYFKNLSSKKRESFFKSNLPPVYPNGWIPVALSSKISNQIEETILCGNDVILFRDENSNITCLDAYCPHLGANLAYGGNIFKINNENCIKCPFHGWSFNAEGNCVNIPYHCSKDIPKKGTSLKKYPVQELNGFIYVWYHADDEDPTWWPELIDEVNTNKWVFMGRTEHIVSCHFQEIPENGADTSHLNAIHQGSVVNGSNICNNKWFNNLINKLNYHEWYAEYDLKDDNDDQITNQQPHACKIYLNKKTIFLSFNVFEMNINVKQIGPAIVHLKFKAKLLGFYEIDAVFIQSIQPLEPFKHRIIHHFHTAEGFFNRILAKLFLYGEATMLERDIAIWSRKKFLKKPFLLKSEKSVAKYRRWFLQFYSPNSTTIETLRNNLLDW